MLTRDLSSGKFNILDESKYNLGQTKKRHGGVIQITDEEYDMLRKKYR